MSIIFFCAYGDGATDVLAQKIPSVGIVEATVCLRLLYPASLSLPTLTVIVVAIPLTFPIPTLSLHLYSMLAASLLVPPSYLSPTVLVRVAILRRLRDRDSCRWR
jgi:hypothetical protein